MHESLLASGRTDAVILIEGVAELLKTPLGQMADAGSMMHCVWALWMLSRENNCLNPLDLLG